MGTSVAPVEVRFSATGVDAVRNSLRLVRDEAQGMGGALNAIGSGASRAQQTVEGLRKESEGLSHSAVIGVGELTRGIGRIVSTGEAGAFAMREISGGVMRFASALGPAGGLIGILALAGGAIYEMFSKTREELRKTEEQFKKSIGNMANAGQGADLKAQARDAYFGTPYDEKGNLQNPSAVRGAYQGSLADLRNRMAGLKSQLKEGGFLANDIENQGIFAAMKKLQPQLDAAEKKFRDIQTALDVMTSRPADMGILPMISNAMSDKAGAKAEQKLDDFVINAIMKSMPRFHDGADSDDMRAMAAAQEQEELNKLLKKYNPGVDHSEARKQLNDINYGMKAKASVIPPSATQQIIASFNENVQQPLSRAIRTGLGSTIGSALAEGITAGFQSHSIGGAFKAAGKAILAGLGSIFEQMGQIWIQYGIAMTSLGEALWNPLTSGPAAIAIGALLVGLGASLGAVAHGGSGGGSAGGSSASLHAVTASAPITVNPNMPNTRGLSAVQPVTVNATIIGKDDPMAQRQLLEMISRAQRRGTVSG